MLSGSQALVDDRGDKWLKIDGVELADVVEVILDVGHQCLLLGVYILLVLAHHLVRRRSGSLIHRRFLLGTMTGHRCFVLVLLLLLLLVDKSLNRSGLIILPHGTCCRCIFLLLNGLANDSDCG